MFTLFCALTSAQQRVVNKFYKRHKTNASCHRLDRVYCIKNQSDNVVAAAFFRTIPDTQLALFRSLYVEPEYRGQGLARQLSQFALAQNQTLCYTLCEPHLLDFYLSLGFAKAKISFPCSHIEKQIKKGLLLLSSRP